jgi:hypothetical protein
MTPSAPNKSRESPNRRRRIRHHQRQAPAPPGLITVPARRIDRSLTRGSDPLPPQVVRTDVQQSHLEPHRTFTCLRVMLDRLRLGATEGEGSPAEEEFREQALWVLHELAAETATALPTLSMMRQGPPLQVRLLFELNPY